MNICMCSYPGRFWKTLHIGLVLLAVCSPLSAYKDQIGFYNLQTRIGTVNTPDGSGIAVTQAEAYPSGTTNYAPNTDDTQFLGKNFTYVSGSTGVSSHATTVARYFYGSISSIAPGIDTIDLYSAGGYLGSDMLNTLSRSLPQPEDNLVQNHSWIISPDGCGSSSLDPYCNDAIRRVDLLAERDGVLVAAGVNNGSTTAMPVFGASAYNVIAVGRSDGNSSYGPTSGVSDGAGRVKPDIVVPTTATSWGTPVVGGAGAMLLETMNNLNTLGYLSSDVRPAARMLLTKAILMGGATKDEFTDWRRGLSTPDTSGVVPLDYRYGAGELNIDNSHYILTSGEYDASMTADIPPAGWDYDTAEASESKWYFFDIPAGQCGTNVSILVTWLRHIDVGNGVPRPLTPTLANIDMRLHQAAGYVATEEIDRSISAIDNVEHIFRTDLPAGRYAIELTSDQQWNYAISWRIDTSTATTGADFNCDEQVDNIDLTYFISQWQDGTCMTPTWCGGADMNTSGKVDVQDYGDLVTQWTPGTP